MEAVGIGERRVVREDAGSSSVVFGYEGDENDDDVSWKGASYLLTDTDVPAVAARAPSCRVLLVMGGRV
jgi:hypothetical protein